MECAVCGYTKPKLKLDYLGQLFCNKCFLKMVDRRISKTIKNNKLIEKDDKIAIAISGGKDSALVLDYLARYSKHGKPKLFAIYVDKGDEYSSTGLKTAKAQAESLGIEFHVICFKDEFNVTNKDLEKIKKQTGLSMCSVCGVFRKYLLNKKAKELGANKVATGHNLTDEAQSYLMNLIRGDANSFAPLGPKSTPIRKGFVQRIRILRQIPENEVREYVKLKGIKHTPNICPHRSGAMRLNTMSVLEKIKKFQPGAEFSICSAGDFISEKVKTGNAIIKTCKYCGEPSAGEICRTCQFLDLLKHKKLKYQSAQQNKHKRNQRK